MPLLLSHTAGQFSGRTLELCFPSLWKGNLQPEEDISKPILPKTLEGLWEALNWAFCLEILFSVPKEIRLRIHKVQIPQNTLVLAHIAKMVFPTLGISRISETCTQMAPWELLGSCNKGRLCKDILWFASGLGSGGPSCRVSSVHLSVKPMTFCILVSNV